MCYYANDLRKRRKPQSTECATGYVNDQANSGFTWASGLEGCNPGGSDRWRGLLMVTGESPEAPLRMMAAMVTGDGVRPPPATFDTVVVPVILSILLAVVFVSVLWR